MRVALRAKGRAEPYELGKLKGANAVLKPACTQTRAQTRSLDYMSNVDSCCCASDLPAMTQARVLYATGSNRTKHVTHLDVSCVVNNVEG